MFLLGRIQLHQRQESFSAFTSIAVQQTARQDWTGTFESFAHIPHWRERTVTPSGHIMCDFLPFLTLFPTVFGYTSLEKIWLELRKFGTSWICVQIKCIDVIWKWYGSNTNSAGSLSPSPLWRLSTRCLRDEAWRYDRLSGVENEVERSSIKREVSPVEYSSKFDLLSKLGHLCSNACFSWLENPLAKKSSYLMLWIFINHETSVSPFLY